jgi:hypothetical protein
VVIGLGRALSRQLTLGGQYELRRAVLSGGQDRFNIETGSATVQYDVVRSVTISGYAGVARLGASATHDARTGPALRAGITQRGRRATLAASYQRSFIPSFGFGGTFQNDEWVGSVHLPFASSRAYVDGSVSRFDNEPLEIGQPSVQSVWFAGTLGYRLSPWLSLEGFYGRTHQNTHRAGGEIGRNQIGFRAVAAKPLRLR